MGKRSGTYRHENLDWSDGYDAGAADDQSPPQKILFVQ